MVSAGGGDVFLCGVNSSLALVYQQIRARRATVVLAQDEAILAVIHGFGEAAQEEVKEAPFESVGAFVYRLCALLERVGPGEDDQAGVSFSSPGFVEMRDPFSQVVLIASVPFLMHQRCVDVLWS